MLMKNYFSKDYLKNQLKTKTYLNIAKENRVSPTTIQRHMAKFGLTQKRNTWTQKDLNKLKENYSKIKDIHKLFPNRTKQSVYHKAHKLNLERHLRKRTYKIKESFFKTFTMESCYILGWMFSDGTVTKDKRTFGFHINKKDVEILKKIKSVMESTHPISIRDNSAELRFHSRIMCEDLISQGCIPNKTNKCAFPKLPKEHFSHFARGYFEGDGSITFNKPNTIKINLVGTKPFLSGLATQLNTTINLNLPNVKKGSGNIWKIEYYGDNARNFCDYIYSDCRNLYLSRKLNKYKRHLELRGKRK